MEKVNDIGGAAPMDRRQLGDALRAMEGRDWMHDGRQLRVLRAEAGEDTVRLVCDRRDVVFPLAAARLGLAAFLPVEGEEAAATGEAAIALPPPAMPMASRHAEGLVEIVRRNIEAINAAAPADREAALRTAEGVGAQVRILVDVFRAEVEAIKAMAALNGAARGR